MKIQDAAATAAAAKIITDREIALRTRIKELEKDTKKLHERLGSRQELIDAVQAAVVAAEPYASIMPVSKKRAHKPEVHAAADVSDLHIGQVISKQETEGFGEFTWTIAQRRFLAYIDDFNKWVNVQRNAYLIRHCHVLLLGDYINGDLRYDATASNEFPVPVQTAHAAWLIGEGIRRLDANFEHVHVIEVGAGNHDRATPKPISAQRTSNSFSYLVHTILNTIVARLPNTEVTEAESPKYVADIAGKKFLLGHGDTAKSWLGVPYYGIEREAAREARRRMRTELGYDFINIGHWHVPSFISGTIVINGSLCGTSEYDHLAGRYAKPSQVAYLVHPRHGLFNLVPFYVQ